MKCGCPITIGADGLPFCQTCKVRLGYLAFSLTEAVHPNAANYYQKQLDEPILDTWLMGNTGTYDNLDGERQMNERNSARNDRTRTNTRDGDDDSEFIRLAKRRAS